MGMRDDKKVRSKTLELGFNSAPRTDTDPLKLDVARTMNVVLSPDGTEAMPREGHVLHSRYNVTSSPVGRKVIVIDRRPPGIGLTANMIISSKRKTVDALIYTKEPTFVSHEDAEIPGTCIVYFGDDAGGAHDYGESAEVSVTRTGDLSTSFSIEVWTVEVNGGSVQNFLGTVDVEANEASSTVPLELPPDSSSNYVMELRSSSLYPFAIPNGEFCLVSWADPP